MTNCSNALCAFWLRLNHRIEIVRASKSIFSLIATTPTLIGGQYIKKELLKRSPRLPIFLDGADVYNSSVAPCQFVGPK